MSKHPGNRRHKFQVTWDCSPRSRRWFWVPKGWMLVPPVIGTLLAAFGLFVVNNELRLFSQVKIAHHVLQERFLESVLKDGDITEKAVDNLNVRWTRWTLFDIYVHILMFTVFLLSLGNTLLRPWIR